MFVKRFSKTAVTVLAATLVSALLVVGCSDDDDGGNNNAPSTTTYTLETSVNPPASGTVSPAGISTHKADTTVTITAEAAHGYKFVRWTGAGVADANSATTTISMTENRSVVASFEARWVTGQVAYGGQTYRTVEIGSQTWLAENLNFNPASGNSWCYDDEPDNCEIYGRLYDWATAMDLPEEEECNRENCASLIETSHKGICPTGWRLPTKDDWEELVTAAGNMETAGGRLKSESGWTDEGGTDDFGFSALPGGRYLVGLGFMNVRSAGNWWSATGDTGEGITAMSVNLVGESDGINFSDDGLKIYGYSVRCVRD